jgi:uncharacterized small protein (DUF1192 family)
VDADGVALASVQALYRAVQDQQEQIRRLQAEIERLKARLDAEAGRK